MLGGIEQSWKLLIYGIVQAEKGVENLNQPFFNNTADTFAKHYSSPSVYSFTMARFCSHAVFLLVSLLTASTHGFTLTPGRSRQLSALTSTVAPDTTAQVNGDSLVSVSESVKKNEAAVFVPPGEAENGNFQCDESVFYWREFASQGNNGNLRAIQDVLARNVRANSMSSAYWSSQILRTSYFVATAVLGTIGSDLHERFIANRSPDNSAGVSFLDLNGGGMTSTLMDSDVPSRLVFEALKCYEQDYKYVESGLLNFPWDSVATANGEGGVRFQLDHKQSNPLFALTETGRVVRESIGIFSRRNKFGGKPSGQVWIEQPSNVKSTSLSYPDYYLNDFHYQTDGWLSSSSANTYEASTETLFLGRQDAMQRQTLIPLLKHFSNNEPSPKTILEVAAGTGRFATFVRDNFPDADITLADLSPFYLEKARENDQYWRRYRGEKAWKELGSTMDSPKPASFVHANAESLPFPDDSFDAVTCVYLFHELPLEARENAAREMARVVKPGGIVSFSDSIQLGDRPPLDKGMVGFSRLNEPHYEGKFLSSSDCHVGTTSVSFTLSFRNTDYVRTSLAPMFERHGLVSSEKYVSSSTKTLSFIKPTK